MKYFKIAAVWALFFGSSVFGHVALKRAAGNSAHFEYAKVFLRSSPSICGNAAQENPMILSHGGMLMNLMRISVLSAGCFAIPDTDWAAIGSY